MPVMILTGSTDLDLARLLAVRLREGGGEVRCYLEEDDWELRDAGCKIAVGDLDDEATLEGALFNAHTFVPLVPEPASITSDDGFGLVVEAARGWSLAAKRSGIEQTILPLPAFPPGAKLGEAYDSIEVAFREAVDPLCVIRTGVLWGPERAFPEGLRSVGDAAHADTVISILRVEDLAEAIAAADDRERLDVIWELGGNPHRLEELLRVAGAGETREMTAWLRTLLSAGLEVGNSAAEELGVQPRPLVD